MNNRWKLICVLLGLMSGLIIGPYINLIYPFASLIIGALGGFYVLWLAANSRNIPVNSVQSVNDQATGTRNNKQSN